MYESFYGLSERPFGLSPDPRFLFLSPQHREALSNLTYGVTDSRAITLLTGEAGTGKTTILHTALAKAPSDTSYVVLNNPTMTRAEFVRWAAAAFGLSAEAGTSKGMLLVELADVLRERHARGQVTTLIVDEAQSLPLELLEEVRLLSNIETATEKLLPIVLIGQPELSERLNQPELRQLKQRVALRCNLTPFDLQTSARYLASRISHVGGEPAAVFTREAVRTIHEASHGIPRTINVISDNALISGFASGTRPVDHRIVRDVCRDFRFSVADSPEPTGNTTTSRAASEPDSDEPVPQSTGTPGETATADSRTDTPERPKRLSFFQG